MDATYTCTVDAIVDSLELLEYLFHQFLDAFQALDIHFYREPMVLGMGCKVAAASSSFSCVV